VSDDGFRARCRRLAIAGPQATHILLVELHAVEAAPTVGFADRREYRVA
jgi:hypothetical protein